MRFATAKDHILPSTRIEFHLCTTHPPGASVIEEKHTPTRSIHRPSVPVPTMMIPPVQVINIFANICRKEKRIFARTRFDGDFAEFAGFDTDEWNDECTYTYFIN